MYGIVQQPVISSFVISIKDADSFFHPATLLHTGFAYDGFAYSAGVQDPTSVASWYSEEASDTRGTGPFPTQVLVLISLASISMLDATNTTLPVWSIFYLGDTNAYAVNPLAQNQSYTATGAFWGNGVLSVNFSADAGTPAAPAIVISYDFVQDLIYMDYSG